MARDLPHPDKFRKQVDYPQTPIPNYDISISGALSIGGETAVALARKFLYNHEYLAQFGDILMTALRPLIHGAVEFALRENKDSHVVKINVPPLHKWVKETFPGIIYVPFTVESMTEIMLRPFELDKPRQLKVVDEMAGAGSPGQFVVTARTDGNWETTSETPNNHIKSKKVLQQVEDGVEEVLNELLKGKQELKVDNKLLRALVTGSVIKTIVPGYNPNIDEMIKHSDMGEFAIADLTNSMIANAFKPEEKVDQFMKSKNAQKIQDKFLDIFINVILKHYTPGDGGLMDQLIADPEYKMYIDSVTGELVTNLNEAKNPVTEVDIKDNTKLRSTLNLTLEASVGSTVSAIITLLWLISQNPKLYEQIKNGTVDPKDAYIAANLAFPPVDITFREAKEDINFLGHQIPKGSIFILGLGQAIERYMKENNIQLFTEDGFNQAAFDALPHEIKYMPWLDVTAQNFKANRECSGRALAIRDGGALVKFLVDHFDGISHAENKGINAVATRSFLIEMLFSGRTPQIIEM